MTINVTQSYLPNREIYKGYIDRIFESGWLTNNSQCVQELTQRLEGYLGVRNLVLVANGTLGLQIAYKALSLSGEVITTPFSFVATSSSLVWEGLTPKFVDICPDTLCINPDSIEAAITEKTTAILPLHVYGYPCNVEAIQKIADRYNLKVIYDAAAAFGVNYQDKSILNHGDISVLSFHATKLFHTAEGGALIIKDDQVYKKIKKMINFGFELDQSGSVSIQELGINAKMSEFHAAMGLAILGNMGDVLKKREAIDRCYRQYLPKTVTIFNPPAHVTQNYSYFPVIFDTEAQLLAIIDALKLQDIIPRQYFYPSLNTLPYFHDINMPVSEDIARRILCLPIFPGLDESTVIQICDTISATL